MYQVLQAVHAFNSTEKIKRSLSRVGSPPLKVMPSIALFFSRKKTSSSSIFRVYLNYMQIGIVAVSAPEVAPPVKITMTPCRDNQPPGFKQPLIHRVTGSIHEQESRWFFFSENSSCLPYSTGLPTLITGNAE